VVGTAACAAPNTDSIQERKSGLREKPEKPKICKCTVMKITMNKERHSSDCRAYIFSNLLTVPQERKPE
jgi:hypothetical protein